MIARFNGAPLSIDLDDVEDVRRSVHQPPAVTSDMRPTGDDGTNSPTGVADYHSTGESPAQQLESHSFATPTIPYQEPPSPKEDVEPIVRPRQVPSRSASLSRRRTSICVRETAIQCLTKLAETPAMGMVGSDFDGPHPGVVENDLACVGQPGALCHSVRRTLLPEIHAYLACLAYTMFNVFLPKLLETSRGIIWGY